MTADTLKTALSSPEALFALMLLASLASGIKQLAVIRQTGTPMTLGTYLSYVPETLGVVLANVIGFAVLILTDQLNFASALGLGYGTNSLVDLLPGKRSIALKATPDDPAKTIAPPPGSAAPPIIKLLVLAPLLGLLLGGCTALGLAPAQTLDQKIEYGYAGVDGVLKAIPPAMAAGSLTSATAAHANELALNVKSILDTARTAESTNATSAQNDLNLATAALTAVQQYLTANGVKP